MIKFQCNCGRKIQVKDELAGKRGKCPKCGNRIQVPKADENDFASGLDEAISMEGAVPPKNMFDCPQCETSLPQTATECSECQLSFQDGNCAVCGKKGNCLCQAKVVVWIKKTKKGHCTNCGHSLPKVKIRDLKYWFIRHCPRCAIDFLLEKEAYDETKMKQSYQTYLETTNDIREVMSDVVRIKLARLKVKSLVNEIERIENENKPKDVNILKKVGVAILVGGLTGNPEFGVAAGASSSSSTNHLGLLKKDEMLIKEHNMLEKQGTLEKLRMLIEYFHVTTNFEHETQKEKSSRELPRKMKWGCSLIIILPILLFGLYMSILPPQKGDEETPAWVILIIIVSILVGLGLIKTKVLD
jgi:hypothetical protein